MKDGNYNLNFDWESVESPKLDLSKNFNRFHQKMYDTCGTGAISLITGLHPKFIEKQLPKPRKHWTDSSICRFLNKRGYKTIPLTKNLVTSMSNESPYAELFYIVTQYHCLLLNSLVCQDEASFFVLHNGHVYHNFKKDYIDPLFLINRPTQTAFIVCHKKWR